MKRFGATPKPTQKYRVRAGAYAVLPRDGKLLVTFQAGIHQELQLPGGGIDPGESAIQALHREVYEETGWRIAAPRLIGRFRRFVFMPDYDLWAEKVCHIYLARPTLRIGPPIENDHTAVWTAPDIAAQNLATEGDRAMVQSLFC